MVVDSYQVVGGGTGDGYYLLVCIFYFYLSFGLSCPVSSLNEEGMIAVVPVSLFIICFLCLQSF